MADKPQPADDLERKLSLYVDHADAQSYVMIKYWDEGTLTKLKDPALASLGTGMMNVVSGKAVSINDTIVSIAGPDGRVQHSIPKDAVLDIAYTGAKPVTEEDMKKFIDG